MNYGLVPMYIVHGCSMTGILLYTSFSYVCYVAVVIIGLSFHRFKSRTVRCMCRWKRGCLLTLIMMRMCQFFIRCTFCFGQCCCIRYVPFVAFVSVV